MIFSTCWYQLKAKFDKEVFKSWIHNMLSQVNNYFLVVYTDEASMHFVKPYESDRVKIIIKPMETFYNYKFREQWIRNHNKNNKLNAFIDWQLNMLWSEKIHFVEQTVNNRYFDDTDSLYGWCDIGYFRNRNGPYFDTPQHELVMWPNTVKVNSLNKTKIHYACINNNTSYVNKIFGLANNKNANGVPVVPFPENQCTIAGGFFILDKSMIEWWRTTYDDCLLRYFENDYLVKDDQIIIADCIFTNMSKFVLHTENKSYDNWFMFQRILQ